jgi:hypothetical protein
MKQHLPYSINRRTFLSRAGGGVGLLALSHLMNQQSTATENFPIRQDPLAPKLPHHRPQAKSVILLFQNGGPSQMDLFDPKPELNRHHGKPYPGKVEAHFHKQVQNLLQSPFRSRPHGDCGMELCELLPHLGNVSDNITLIRSMNTESVDHERALRLIHSGTAIVPKASFGSWVVYGLGTERDDLPAYVVLTDPGGMPIDGVNNWNSAFLPATYQGTQFRSTGQAVVHLNSPKTLSKDARLHQLHFLKQLNSAHHTRHPENNELQTRIDNFELAARMQTAVPGVIDLSGETKETRALYGLDQKETADYGGRCLLARRLVEQGVRFVSVYLNSQPWDTHSKNAANLRGLCKRTDQPSAALVTDLKRRGLLEDTIVIWTGEFGRLPVSQGPDGRDHNRHAFSLWIAGGGFKQGYVHGATDDFGYKANQDVVGVHDLHATLLHSLGLDHQRLTFHHEGRDDTLTDVVVTNAQVVPELLA